MRYVKITVTDETGVVLDREEIELKDDCVYLDIFARKDEMRSGVSPPESRFVADLQVGGVLVMTPKTYTMTDLMSFAKKLGAEVHNNSTRKVWDYGIEAPAGKLWNATETHELILHQAKGPPAWLTDAVTSVIDDMKAGLMDCDDPDCDWCHPEECHERAQ